MFAVHPLQTRYILVVITVVLEFYRTEKEIGKKGKIQLLNLAVKTTTEKGPLLSSKFQLSLHF
jgi:hypothetical protein